jgi:hypothetical protein
LYLTYEKMLYLNKLKHIKSIEQQSILNKTRLVQCQKMARSSSNIGLKRKMTSDKLTANNETFDANENQQEKMSTDLQITDENRFPYISLQLLLNSVQIKDLKQYFNTKLKFLIRALNVEDELLVRYNQLHSHMNITYILYSKYNIVFDDLFKRNSQNDSDYLTLAHRIGWLLFISIKCKYPHLRNDLINSYHLLICSVSYSYVKYFVEDNSEMNIDDISNKDEKYHKVMQTIDYLCVKYEENDSETSNSIQIKTVFEYHFKTHSEKLEAHLKNFFSQSKDNTEKKFTIKSKMNTIYEKLNLSYEQFLQKGSSNSQNERKSNCCLNDMSYSLEIDERLYLHSNGLTRNREEYKIDSPKYLFILPEYLNKFLNKQNKNLENEDPIKEKFDIKPLFNTLRNALCEHLVQNDSSNELNVINQFIQSLNNFYTKMVDVILLNEKISFYSSTEEAQRQFQHFSKVNMFIQEIISCRLYNF